MMRILESMGITFLTRDSAGRERGEMRLLAAKAEKPRSRTRSDHVERGNEWAEGGDCGEDERADGCSAGSRQERGLPAAIGRVSRAARVTDHRQRGGDWRADDDGNSGGAHRERRADYGYARVCGHRTRRSWCCCRSGWTRGRALRSRTLPAFRARSRNPAPFSPARLWTILMSFVAEFRRNWRLYLSRFRRFNGCKRYGIGQSNVSPVVNVICLRTQYNLCRGILSSEAIFVKDIPALRRLRVRSRSALEWSKGNLDLERARASTRYNMLGRMLK
jgi:hypothetical protein